MIEQPPTATIEKKGENLDRLLSVKISQGASENAIQRNIESGIWLRFVVTEEFDIVLDTGANSHEGIIEDNDLDPKKIVIPNGAVREDDDFSIVFSYQASSRTPLNDAVEKKLVEFLRARGVRIDSERILRP